MTVGVKALLAFAGRPVMSTVIGGFQTAMAVTALVGPLLGPSVAASAFTITSTFLLPSGVTISVYSLLLPAVKVFFVPPVTVISSVLKPVTVSLKVNLAVRSSVLLIHSGSPVMVTVGAMSSQIETIDLIPAGPLLRPSVTLLAATLTVSASPSSGVITSV